MEKKVERKENCKSVITFKVDGTEWKETGEINRPVASVSLQILQNDTTWKKHQDFCSKLKS